MDGKRVCRPDPVLIELDGLTINQARSLIKRKGWRATIVTPQLRASVN
jgi:hypothetical protein